MGSIEKIHTVAEHIIRAKNEGNHVVVVVSAMSGETNRLMALATQVDNVPNARELDVLLSAGEQVSMALLAMTLHKQGYAACSLTGTQARIVTDNQHNEATIKQIDVSVINTLLEQDQIVVVAGFQGINERGAITTLGRGGSDTTAVTLAGVLDADECQIFTDVDGIYSCDPRVVKHAQKLETIDFPSMEEMARKGAKVLHLPSVQFAWSHSVPLRVLSTFDTNAGSLVKGEVSSKAVCGLAIQRHQMALSLESKQVPSLLAQCRILGIETWCLIEQEERANLVIQQDQYVKLSLVASEQILQHEAVSQLTVVGNQAPDLVESAYHLLEEQGIAVRYHHCSQGSLTLVMLPECIDKAANILHDAYITLNDVLDFQQKQAFLG